MSGSRWCICTSELTNFKRCELMLNLMALRKQSDKEDEDELKDVDYAITDEDDSVQNGAKLEENRQLELEQTQTRNGSGSVHTNTKGNYRRKTASPQRRRWSTSNSQASYRTSANFKRVELSLARQLRSRRRELRRWLAIRVSV